MSLQNPPKLLELAVQSLLRKEAMTISVLEELPMELFPLLFMEAFIRKHSETLKAMVQAWPFSCLPLGSLMKTPQLDILRPVLEGLDALLTQEVRSRRWKLQVLNLVNVDENFWSVWSGALTYSLKDMSKRQTLEDCPRMGRMPPLKVFIDLCLKKTTLEESFAYLLQWVKQRKSLLHLCCKKLVIFAMPIENVREVLKMVSLDCIQEVEIYCLCELSTLARFAPYLGKMCNLRKLILFNIHESVYTSPEKKEERVAQFTSQFRKLDYLQKLYMYTLSFLEGHLDQLLRCLKSSLETLLLTNCLLSEADLVHLSEWPKLHQLKELSMKGIVMTHFSPEPLQVLLEKVAATLQTLKLDECGITDSQLNTILPALSHCSQLTTFSFCGNPISRVTLESLLRHTVGLRKLSLELYPIPPECYDTQGVLYRGRLAQLGTELKKILRGLRQPKRIMFSTNPCPHCGIRSYYDL
ncbi:PRAME family member 12-like [Carlito syrichta]|uniref:PRAME family member 12-like n=1 Tax=Carlito syrichta TaxID=1868482 RepID=A0A1U7SVY3_CARSF|nr:PRAME family member 12-like [Carlito syrichta]